MEKDDHLGTGLKALFGDNLVDFIEDIQQSGREDNYGRKATLNVNEIRSNPYQPRVNFDEKTLNELAQSIAEHGVFSPIIVRQSISGYELIAGERRLRASKLAGKDTIPAIILDVSDQQMMEISLLENIQRDDLNAIEEAGAYRQLMDRMGYTQEQLAQRVGKSREYVGNMLRVLKLPTKVQKLIEEGKLTVGQARPLITMENPQEAVELAERIVREKLSARDVENYFKGIELSGKKPPQRKPQDSATREVQKQLQRKFGTRVRISGSSINIYYDGVEDLNRILDLMGYDEEI